MTLLELPMEDRRLPLLLPPNPMPRVRWDAMPTPLPLNRLTLLPVLVLAVRPATLALLRGAPDAPLTAPLLQLPVLYTEELPMEERLPVAVDAADATVEPVDTDDRVGPLAEAVGSPATPRRTLCTALDSAVRSRLLSRQLKNTLYAKNKSESMRITEGIVAVMEPHAKNSDGM